MSVLTRALLAKHRHIANQAKCAVTVLFPSRIFLATIQAFTIRAEQARVGK